MLKEAPRIGEPESAMVPGMSAPAPRPLALPPGVPAIPDTSTAAPTPPGLTLQEPARWFYDFDPATGAARATFPGEVAPANVTNIIGVTDGSNAPAGMVGEYLITTAIGGPVSPGVGYTAAQLALPAGDWDVGATIEYAFTTATGVTLVAASIQAPVGTLAQGLPALWNSGLNLSGSITFGAPVGQGRYSSAAPVTLALVATVIWSTANAIVPTGSLWARRRR
jgi:hypothetical protein